MFLLAHMTFKIVFIQWSALLQMLQWEVRYAYDSV